MCELRPRKEGRFRVQGGREGGWGGKGEGGVPWQGVITSYVIFCTFCNGDGRRESKKKKEKRKKAETRILKQDLSVKCWKGDSLWHTVVWKKFLYIFFFVQHTIVWFSLSKWLCYPFKQMPLLAFMFKFRFRILDSNKQLYTLSVTVHTSSS